jgi:hypothetical protein
MVRALCYSGKAFDTCWAKPGERTPHYGMADGLYVSVRFN